MNIRRGLPIGGQALPNGVMMRSSQKTAIALRLRSGRIVTGSWPTNQKRIMKKTMLRGIYQLFVSFKASFQTVFRAFRLSKQAGEMHIRPSSIICTATAVVLVCLYVFVSDRCYSYLGILLPIDSQPYLFTLSYGMADLILFIITLYAVTCLPCVRKLLRYHGAEHKAITCYEKGLDMTTENVRAQSRFHRRCGTSMVVIIALAGVIVPVFIPPALDEIWQELIFAFCMLIAVGIAYEAMRAKKTTLLTRLGLAAQRITTRDPDDDMIECAISALAEAAKID